MSKMALPCIVCGKELINVDEDIDNQPYVGTEFQSRGHYGSTIIDEHPADQKEPFTFVVNICDTCIIRALDAGVIQSRRGDIALSRHPVDDAARAWVLAQNYKQYGAVWGEDEVVDYDEEMRKAGWDAPDGEVS